MKIELTYIAVPPQQFPCVSQVLACQTNAGRSNVEFCGIRPRYQDGDLILTKLRVGTDEALDTNIRLSVDGMPHEHHLGLLKLVTRRGFRNCIESQRAKKQLELRQVR